jgi:hypothetical protein
MMKDELIIGIVILIVTLPITLTWNLMGVHVDVQAIYGGTLGAIIGIGLDRLIKGIIGSK